jgi:prolyl oligopeptidase
VETWHGTAVADPYRWLEEPGAARTRGWVAAQRALADGYLAGLVPRPWFTACVDRILGTPRAGVPERRGGRYLLSRNDGTHEQDYWQVAEDLATLVAGGGRRLLDPAEFDPDGRVAVTGVTLSPDGRWLAYGLNQAGSDWTTWRVRDAATGIDLDDRVSHAKFGSPRWLPSSGGFLYWGFPAAARTRGDDPAALPNGSLRCHRLGAPEADDQVVHRPATRREVALGQVTDDGRWLVLSFADGIARRSRVAVRRIGAGDVLGPRLDVVGQAYARFELAGSDRDVLYLRTDHDADRCRLMAVDLAALADGGGRPDARWHEVVPERALVLEQAVRAGDGFLAVYLDDASHRVFRLAADGTERGEVGLDRPVAVAAVHGRAGEPEAFLGVTSFTQDIRCYRLDLATGTQEELPLVTRPAGTVAQVQTRRGQATSADGTPVPYFLVRRADQPPGRPCPSMLFGYGAHQIAMTPIFRPAWPAWVEAGGVLVVANLRGGGEYGRSWYESGSRDRKQNVFDDYIAVAEDLCATGVTTREQLALHGRSHGGLLVSAVLTQRPDLAAVALPMVGIMDMLRFHRFTIGWAWTPEHGDPAVPADFAVLRAYSPLHQVREGTDYPAVLVLTGDHDDRAVPAHSYKFTAALQHASAGSRPVLLRIDPVTGHGGTGAASKPRAALVAETADLLAFAATHTGLVPATLEAPDDPLSPDPPASG